MKKEKIIIHGVSVILWGEKSSRVAIVTHGSQSHKEDRFIQACANNLCNRGFQIISFDLPEHGERRNTTPIHTINQVMVEMKIIMHFAIEHYSSIYLIGCSLGAYYTLLAYQSNSIEQCALLSPVVDLIELTLEMLENDNRTINDVIENNQIILSNGIIVRLEDYQYLIEHKIKEIQFPISILYGQKDKLIRFESIQKFVRSYDCECIVSKKSEHHFHTIEDMYEIDQWLNRIK